MKKTFFISDLHLSDNRPELTESFIEFMQNHAKDAEKLYILGDLFDFWIGDDEKSVVIEAVKEQILKLTLRGVKCYFVAGNRDFLLGESFAQASGIILLSDYTVIDLYGIPTLLCHGDTLCIDDTKYQHYRKKVHQKWRQWLFLKLPLLWRMKIAQKIRQKSQADKRHKITAIMDVNTDFVEKMMQQFEVQYLIHGHTHRQNIHQIAQGTRIVLGDWGDTFSILCVYENGQYTFFNENLTNMKSIMTSLEKS